MPSLQRLTLGGAILGCGIWYAWRHHRVVKQEEYPTECKGKTNGDVPENNPDEKQGVLNEEAKKPSLPQLSTEEVQKHSIPGDCWLVIENHVYDVSAFALNHPGGADLIHDLAGTDATETFLEYHPSEYAPEYAGPAIGIVLPQPVKTVGPPPVEGSSFAELREALSKGVLTVTGGFGAMVQRYMREVEPLTEADYRSCDELRHHPQDLFGNHDVLCLSRPDVVQWVYRKSMEGCDIVGTSTFNTTRISQHEYGIVDGQTIYQMARRSAEIGREAKNGLHRRFVGGQIGPTTRTACVATDVDDASMRTTDFDELAVAYGQLVEGLMDGHADVIMIDCAFDSLNVKAAIYALEHAFARKGVKLPVLVSMSLVDDSGRTLSGQSVEAFYATVRHARPFTIGFNCGAGPEQMQRYVKRMSDVAECFTHAYPNAGLPNAVGCYDLEPQPMADQVSAFAHQGFANVVGGCCGAGPEHLSCIRKCAAEAVNVRVPSSTNNGGHFDSKLYSSHVITSPARRPRFLLSGSEALVWSSNAPRLAVMVDLTAASDVSSVKQVRDACSEEDAHMVGILLRARGDKEDAATEKLFRAIQGEPELSTKPLVLSIIDPLTTRSQSLLIRLLKCLQGRSLVDLGRLPADPSSLAFFVREIHFLGASIMVHYPGSASAAASLINFTSSLGFMSDEVVFTAPSPADVKVACSHITALRLNGWEAPYLPPKDAQASDWAAARARAYVRSSECIADIVICPASRGASYMKWMTEASKGLGDADAPQHKKPQTGTHEGAPTTAEEACARLCTCVELGVDDGAEECMHMALSTLTQEQIITVALMGSMRRVSDDYTSGRTSLPQVLKSSRVLKKLVRRLQQVANEGDAEQIKAESKGERIVLATVKGDVHDLGKTIVGILLRCNGYDVHDLGRNVDPEIIVDACLEGEGATVVGLSGMISPSLRRMVECVEMMKTRGVTCPVLIGGSATSAAFCALMLDSLAHAGGCFRIPDGPKAVLAAHSLVRSGLQAKEEWAKGMTEGYAQLREQLKDSSARAHKRMLALEAARSKAHARRQMLFPQGWRPHMPQQRACTVCEISFTIAQLLPLVNWTYFYAVFGLRGRPPHHGYPALLDDPVSGDEARKLRKDLEAMLACIDDNTVAVKGARALLPARARGDDICIVGPSQSELVLRCLRQQEGECFSLSDFVYDGDGDHVGVFCCAACLSSATADRRSEEDDKDDYKGVMMKALEDRLVEAAAEMIHCNVRTDWYDDGLLTQSPESLLKEEYAGVRPAVGYPSLPDHRILGDIWTLLEMDNRPHLGVTMTESFALDPEAAVAGLMLSHRSSAYFAVGKVTEEQVQDYASRGGEAEHEAKQWLAESILSA